MRRLLLLVFAAACSPGFTTDVIDNMGRSQDVPVKPETPVAEVRALLRRGDLGGAARAADTLPTTSDARELGRVIAFLRGGEGVEDAALERQLDVDTLAALATLAPETPAGGYVHARLALIHLHQGESSAEALALAGRAPRYAEALTRAVAEVEARRAAVDPKAIGVLLPLTGPFRSLGESALRAIQHAVGKGSGLKLVVKDTRGDAEAAARLVDQLVSQSHVAALLGPIGASESTAAVQRAAELQIPILTLSAREGLVEAGGGWALRTRLTPSRQGLRLARYAVNELGLSRFALLVSDDPYGWALAGAFWDEVLRLKADVVAAWAYPRGTTAYRDTVRRLLEGGDPKKKGRPDFDALLVADDHATVRKLLPFFPYFGIPVRRTPSTRLGVQLLGGDGWDHPDIVDLAEQQTDNAVFCDSFFADESNAAIQRFVTSFYERYREPPSPFEAEVYDAAQLLASVLRSAGQTRSGLRDALLKKTFTGVTGTLRFDEHGDGLKDVFVLTVDKDVIRLRTSEPEERALRAGRPQ